MQFKSGQYPSCRDSFLNFFSINHEFQFWTGWQNLEPGVITGLMEPGPGQKKNDKKLI